VTLTEALASIQAATADDTVELTFWTDARAIYVVIVDRGRWRTPSDQPTGRGRESRSCSGSSPSC
jgi:hypothetical protein